MCLLFVFYNMLTQVITLFSDVRTYTKFLVTFTVSNGLQYCFLYSVAVPIIVKVWQWLLSWLLQGLLLQTLVIVFYTESCVHCNAKILTCHGCRNQFVAANLSIPVFSV